MDEDKAQENRFQIEMTRMMTLVITKIGDLETGFSGLTGEVSGLAQNVSSLNLEVSKNSQKLDILSEQFTEVVSMVINDNKRINKLEDEVAELQSNIH